MYIFQKLSSIRMQHFWSYDLKRYINVIILIIILIIIIIIIIIIVMF